MGGAELQRSTWCSGSDQSFLMHLWGGGQSGRDQGYSPSLRFCCLLF